jgi:hypothetical protein
MIWPKIGDKNKEWKYKDFYRNMPEMKWQGDTFLNYFL